MAPLPLLFMLGTSLVRAATPAIARQMAKKLPKPTVKQARQRVTQTINSIKAVDKLKPSTKVVGKKKGASTTTGSPSPAPKPKPAGLKPTRNPDLAKAAKKTTKKPIDKGKSIATGTVLTVATLPLTMKKDKSVKAENTPTKKDSGAKPKKAVPKANTPKAKETKNFNVGVSKGGVSFNTAFAHFRKKGAKTFTWNGKKYTTKLKSEK